MEVEDERAGVGCRRRNGRKESSSGGGGGGGGRRFISTEAAANAIPARPPVCPDQAGGRGGRRGSLWTAQGKEGSKKTMEKGKWHAKAEKNFGPL